MSRYAERSVVLQALSARLSVAGVPHEFLRRLPNGAPSVGHDYDDAYVPALSIARGWRMVKALYFDGELRLSYPYLASRSEPATADGIDRVAARITADYLDAKARGEVDERRM